MTVTSLDKIVKSILVKRGYSMHYYMQMLVYAAACLRELSFDGEIEALRYKVITLTDNNAAPIPNDYVDYARVSIRAGQYLHPLVEDNSLDLIPNYDSDFTIQPFSDGIASSPATSNPQVPFTDGYDAPYWWLNNWSAFGENTGRQFGGVGYSDTFRINKARNEIKISEDYPATEIVLEYVSNGQDADSATHVDAYSQDTIENYCLWQHKENNRTYSSGESQIAKQGYIQSRQILRARRSDLTIDRLKRIVQKNSIAIKY